MSRSDTETPAKYADCRKTLPDWIDRPRAGGLGIHLSNLFGDDVFRLDNLLHRKRFEWTIRTAGGQVLHPLVHDVPGPNEDGIIAALSVPGRRVHHRDGGNTRPPVYNSAVGRITGVVDEPVE